MYVPTVGISHFLTLSRQPSVARAPRIGKKFQGFTKHFMPQLSWARRIVSLYAGKFHFHFQSRDTEPFVISHMEAMLFATHALCDWVWQQTHTIVLTLYHNICTVQPYHVYLSRQFSFCVVWPALEKKGQAT